MSTSSDRRILKPPTNSGIGRTTSTRFYKWSCSWETVVKLRTFVIYERIDKDLTDYRKIKKHSTRLCNFLPWRPFIWSNKFKSEKKHAISSGFPLFTVTKHYEIALKSFIPVCTAIERCIFWQLQRSRIRMLKIQIKAN